MLESYKWMGWMGLGLGWKSLKALILRAPLCGAIKSLKGIQTNAILPMVILHGFPPFHLIHELATR